MTFQYPWLLWGVLAAAIPIAIHLINRQRARVVRFAALEHLLLSDKRLAQRLKLRQLLVLILRVALIAVLAIALAKPSLERGDLVASELAGPGAVAIIIDDSLSMNAIAPEQEDTSLELAIASAEAAVSSGGAQTSFAIMAAGTPARVLTQGATFDRQSVARALASITPGPRGSDMAGALREAERVLSETGQASRRVVIIGDHAAHAWEDISSPWALDDPPTVEVIDIRLGTLIPNLAITAVEVRPAPEVGAAHVRVLARVTNHGAEPTSTTLTVRLGDRTAKAHVDLAAGAAGEVSTTLVRPEAEAPLGLASLPQDALADDNEWSFGLGDGEAIGVGLVNGAPHDVANLDEVFFLRAALDAIGPGARLETTPLDGTAIDTARLRHLDVLVLANPGLLGPVPLAAIRDFVQRGGGLMITAGDRLTSEAADALGDLLPIPLRGYKQVADPDDPNAALSALHIADFDLEHPATALFSAVDDVSLLKARTYRVALLEPTGSRARVLASFAGGIPALVEGRLGDGRSMLLTTTVDRDWSDLAIRTSFVPLIHQVMAHLARRGDGLNGANVRVGQVAKIALPPGRGSLALMRPDGAEVMLEIPDSEEEIPTLTINDIDVTGRYTLRRRGGKQQAVHFTAHADPDESDLEPADRDALDRLLDRAGATARHATARPEGDLEGARHPLWPYLLVSLFGLLASETWFVLRQ